MSGFKLLSFFAITDEEAMHRVRLHDDAEAFTQLVSRWRAPIERLCTRMLGDSHRGEDLAQETFSKIYTRRKDYRDVSQTVGALVSLSDFKVFRDLPVRDLA